MKPYYEHDNITIYHGDCREILPGMPQVDLVLTDPPYGIGETEKKAMSRVSKTGKSLSKPRKYFNDSWDLAPIDNNLIQSIIAQSKKSVVFGGNYYDLPPTSCWLIWDKLNGGSDFADCELAWTNLKQAVRIKKHLWNGMLRKGAEERFHLTQKPLEVITWCIVQADKHGQNNTILDPFMGSGTTLVAAKNLRRKAIGIEKEEKYCEIAVKRLAQEVLF